MSKLMASQKAKSTPKIGLMTVLITQFSLALGNEGKNLFNLQNFISIIDFE